MASNRSLSLVRLCLAAIAVTLSLQLILFGRTAFSAPSISTTYPEVIAPALALACLLNLVIVATLLLTAKHWLPAFKPSGQEAPPSIRRSAKLSRLYLFVLLPIALAAFVAFPRLDHSLWGDEQFTTEFYVLGQFDRDLNQPEPHPPKFEPATWTDALFLTDFDNHWLNTLTAKLANSSWQKFAGAPPWVFSETALRLFPLLAGLCAIAAWSVLSRRIGLSQPFVLWVAFALALHPWFLRHITESRGYPFVLLFEPLVLLAAWKAISKDAISPWFTLAALQFLLIYSWPGSILSVITLNLAIFLTIRSRKEDRRTLFIRWILPSLAAFAVLIQLTAPCIPQMLGFLRSPAVEATLEPNWILNVAAHFFAGIDAIPYPTENPSPHYLTLQGLNPILTISSTILLTSFFVLGAIHLRHNPLARLAAISILLPALLIALYALISRHHVFPWYLLPALPAVIVGVVAGFEFLFLKSRILGMALSILAAATWIAVAIPQIRILRNHDTDPLRPSVLATRPSRDLQNPAQDQILTAHLYSTPSLYDPHGYSLSLIYQENAAYPGLFQLMRLADQNQIPLTVNAGFPQQARVLYPDLMNLLEKPDFFEPMETFHGIEPQFTRRLYRYRGGKSADSSHAGNETVAPQK